MIKDAYASGDFNSAYRMLESNLYNNSEVLKFPAEYNLPAMVTEFGWYGTESENWQQNMKDYLSLLNKYDVNWYVWWWWSNPDNLGLATPNYDNLSPQGEIWAQYLGP